MHSSFSLRRDLSYSSFENILCSFMVGIGETFLPAFALAVGIGGAGVGLFVSIPFLLGSVIQLGAPKALKKFRSHRRFLVFLSALQGISFLLMAALSLTAKPVNLYSLFAVATLYWGAGMAAGPTWNSWMSCLLPERLRRRHFAHRSFLGQLSLLTGLALGGMVLQIAHQSEWERLAFGLIFSLAGIARLISSYLLSKKSEPAGAIQAQKRVPVRSLFERIRNGKDGRLVLFLLLFGVATNIAGPFFNPYMLTKLSLPYSKYMILIAATFIAKILVFSSARELSSRIHPLAFIRAGVLGSCVLPLLWIVSSNFIYLFAINLVSGAVWAVFDLGVMLSLFGVIKDEEKASFLSYYGFASAVSLTLGSMIGAKLLTYIGDSANGYFIVFGACASFRFAAFLGFNRLSRSSREARAIRSKEIAVSLALSASSQVTSGLRKLQSVANTEKSGVKSRAG